MLTAETPIQELIEDYRTRIETPFGTYDFQEELRVGTLIPFSDAADYTMVKKNWFNGVAMPSIVVRRLDGTVDVVKRFDYEDFVSAVG